MQYDYKQINNQIGRVGHTEPGPGQGRAIGVVKSVQYWVTQGLHTRIEWVPGHTGIVDDKKDQIFSGAKPP
jgi:hypothetical protein